MQNPFLISRMQIQHSLYWRGIRKSHCVTWLWILYIWEKYTKFYSIYNNNFTVTPTKKINYTVVQSNVQIYFFD